MWSELLTAGGGIATPLFLSTVVIPLLGHLVPDPELDVDVDVPTLPLPDLPDLPSIPWPDFSLPDLPLPDWAWDVTKLVVVVAIAWVISRKEVTRLRTEMARRASEQTLTAGAETDTV